MEGQTKFQFLLRSATVLLLLASLSEAQTTDTTRPPTTDSLMRDLQFTLPIVSIFIIIVIILTIIICVVYKARYGQFCCLKPRMRFRPPSSHGSDEEGEADDQQGHALPKYPTREIAPPDYQDAMQDMLVSSGGPNHPEVPETTAEPPASEEETSEPEPAEISDESLEYDDHTPLNP